MANRKHTRRALLSAFMALVMCCSMFVGTTFAWFTDTAKTGVNKIQAGTLQIELWMQDSSGEYVNISDEEKPIFGNADSLVAQNNNLDTLWEPGKTQIAFLEIRNVGSLALKYRVELDVKDVADSKDLYKAMEYAIVPDAKSMDSVMDWSAYDADASDVVLGSQLVSDLGANNGIKLLPKESHFFALAVHMKEEAGNEYQGGKIEFDLSVLATQQTYESDSFDDQYDVNAMYPEEVATASELAAALENGGNIKLVNDISFDTGITIAEGDTFNGNGYTLTYSGTDYNYQLVKLSNNAILENVTLENFRVKAPSTSDSVITLSDVTIKMENDLTGLDISSNGGGKAVLTNVTCAGITDIAHLDPATQLQVDYTPYGDVLLGGSWALEASDCHFGSLHGWNTRNGSNVWLVNTTYAVFRMHYWSGRTLYINGVETAWSDSDVIPVAHDVGGCWSVQPAFK